MYERVYVCMQVRVIEMGWDINCMEWEVLIAEFEDKPAVRILAQNKF